VRRLVRRCNCALPGFLAADRTQRGEVVGRRFAEAAGRDGDNGKVRPVMSKNFDAVSTVSLTRRMMLVDDGADVARHGGCGLEYR